MTNSTNDIQPMRSRLRKLRLSVRALYLLNGVSRLFILAVILIVATFVLDRFLVLPRSVRTLMFFGAICSICVSFLRHLVYPLAKPLSDEDLAATVEKRFPDLKDRLISSIEFARTIDSPDFPDSKELARETIRTTLDRIQELRFRKVLVSGSVLRFTAGALIGTAVLLSYAFSEPELTRTWFRRMVALQNLKWPQQTRLEVIFPSNQEGLFYDPTTHTATLASGEDLTVQVQVNRRKGRGRVPSVSITYEIQSDRPGSSNKETRILKRNQKQNKIPYTFNGVTDSFRFFVRGGDDQSGKPVYSVRVLPPPRVETLSLACTYPSYTGREPETVDGGTLEAPADTKVRLHLETNLDVEKAHLVLSKDDAVPLEAEGPRSFAGEFTIDKNLLYSFTLLGANGLKNTRPVRFSIRSIPDTPPSLQVYGIGGFDFDATVEAALPIRVITQDDYGISAIRLLCRMGQKGRPLDINLGPDAHIPEGTVIEDDNPDFPSARRILTVSLLDIRALSFPEINAPLEPGDVLYYHVEAEDNHTDTEDKPLPQRKVTQPFRIHLVERSELERKLNDWQVRIKTQIHKMVANQESLRDGLVQMAELDGGADRLAPADAQKILDSEIDQNRITNDAKQVTRDFRQIFNTYLFNRIESSPLTEKLISRLQESARRFDVEELERYRELFSQVSHSERQKSDILGKQLTMMELMIEVAETHSPDATKHLTAARKAIDATERKGLLRSAADLESRILESLEALLDKMQEWEDYQEVLQETKELIQLQKEVRKSTLREIEKTKERRNEIK